VTIPVRVLRGGLNFQRPDVKDAGRQVQQAVQVALEIGTPEKIRSSAAQLVSVIESR
jgi:hypothetical protein